MMEEIWKDIEGYVGLYQVSNTVKVKSLQRTVEVIRSYGTTTRIVPEKILITGVGNGYNTVNLWKGNKGKTHKIAVLAATAFISNPNNFPIVNHLDGVKTNDFLLNYEWTNHSGNALHAVEFGLTKHAKGVTAGASKLTEDQVRAIRLDSRSSRVIALKYNLGHSNINAIKSRKTWKHII